MRPHTRRSLIVLSAGLNILVALPALVLICRSRGIRYEIYQNILAPRFGRPETIFIGDSITRGGDIWALRIGELNFNTWNYGHGGLTTRQLQFYANKAAHLNSVRRAFVMAGINDPDKTARGAEASFEDYRTILATLQKAGITPIVQLTLYRQNEPNPAYIDRLNQRLSDYARQHRLKVIDLNPILCPHNSLLARYTIDGVHLNEEAYRIWGEKIRQTLSVIKAESRQATPR